LRDVSRPRDAADEFDDLFLELVRLERNPPGIAAHEFRRRAGAFGGAAQLVQASSHRAGGLGHALRIAGNLSHRGILLLDRRRDHAGEFVHLADALGDAADRADGAAAATWLEISSVARPVCAASALTSPATTAKPRPASPARAASIVALSARRFV
jgi:hypothetical protein